METLPITNTLTIRECGFDEYWLQEQIFNNPNCLGLGELSNSLRINFSLITPRLT